MKEIITKINEYINSLDVFTSWGGYCLLKSDEALPIGIGQFDKCKGNLYGFNDKYISGFFYLKNISSNEMFFEITLGLYTFVPHKLTGDNHNYYNFPMWLLKQLKMKFRQYDFDLSVSRSDKYIDREVAEIEIKFKEYSDCNDFVKGDEIC